MPMTQYIPKMSVFCLENYLFTAGRVIAGNTGVVELPRYPATNLLLEQRSERWRGSPSIGVNSGLHNVAFDLGAPCTPNVFGAIDSRAYDPNQGGWIEYLPIRVYGSTVSDFSAAGGHQITLTPYSAWLPGGASIAGSYDQIFSQGGVFLQYNDIDDYSATIAPKRFWCFQFNALANANAFIECGAFWLGRRWEVPVDIKFRTQSESNSQMGRLDSGAKYFDIRRRSRSFALTTTTSPTEDRLAFRGAVEQSEGHPVIADLWAFRTNPANGASYPERVDGMIYGLLDGRTTWEMRTVKAGRFAFNLDEAIA